METSGMKGENYLQWHYGSNKQCELSVEKEWVEESLFPY